MHRNEPDEAFRIVESLFSLADYLKDEPGMVSQLVRISILGIAIHVSEDSLNFVQLEDKQLEGLQTLIRQIDMRSAAHMALMGERTMSFTVTTWPPAFIAEGKPSATRDQVMPFEGKLPDRHFDAALILQLFRRQLAAVDESWAAAFREAAVQERELKQLAKSPTRFLYIYTMLLYPAVPSALNAFARTEAALKACDSAIAAVRFRRARGDWPAQLDELSPDFLLATPSDPYDSQPLRFVRTAESLKFYSVGQDLVDDGGTWEASEWKPDVGVKIPVTAKSSSSWRLVG